jgi:hypothetical protein
MAKGRPMEQKRARRGLGARSAEGDIARAKPRGRMKGAPGGSRNTQSAGPTVRTPGKPHQPRVAQARRRTVRDNPEATN